MAETFVDYLKLHVKAGDGGNGAVAFRREAFVPRGGPSGGDGGKGGSIVLVPDPKLGTLLDLKYRTNIVADNGRPGSGNNCHGADGKDIRIAVPLGTTVTDAATEELLADLTTPGEEWVAAKGGRGGLGNAHFATARNRTPTYAQEGEEGEERHLILELKLIAQVGLVGLPNAGKSTLLSKLTAATPKIAAYPFTTLSPNLGVLEYEDHARLTIADIPGLIEGASHGAGLGHRFLRHIERTRLLVHLVGDEEGIFDPEDMLYKFDLVCQEMASYSDKLATKPQTVVITKIDLAIATELEKTREAFRARGLEPLCVSAMTGEGLEELREYLRRAVSALEESEEDEFELRAEADLEEEEMAAADEFPGDDPAGAEDTAFGREEQFSEEDTPGGEEP